VGLSGSPALAGSGWTAARPSPLSFGRSSGPPDRTWRPHPLKEGRGGLDGAYSDRTPHLVFPGGVADPGPIHRSCPLSRRLGLMGDGSRIWAPPIPGKQVWAFGGVCGWIKQPILSSRAAQPTRDPSTDHLHRRGGSDVSGWVPDMGFAHSGKTGERVWGCVRVDQNTLVLFSRASVARPGTHPPIILHGRGGSDVSGWVPDKPRLSAGAFRENRGWGFGGVCGWIKTPHLVFPGGVADPGPIHRSCPPVEAVRRLMRDGSRIWAAPHSGKTGVGVCAVCAGGSNHPVLFSRASVARPRTHPPKFSTAEAVQTCRDGSRIWAAPIPGKQRVGVWIRGSGQRSGRASRGFRFRSG
jgi:hypothetical protein